MPRYYRQNVPNVTSEYIDGEFIIVNLETGVYYSTVDLGAYLWGHIAGGDSAEAIVEEIRDAFADEGAHVEATVAEFISRLEEEQLIVRSEGPISPEGSGQDNNAGQAQLPKEFSGPVLNCYSDMQDMLLLDPVHDVADVGWPTARSK